MRHDMADILDLVRSGRLQDATGAIRQRLAAGDVDAEFGSPGPMKDVTPRTCALAREGATIETVAGMEATGGPATKTSPQSGRMAKRDGPVPYRLYTPSRPVANAPLIVMLHGCTQNPEDFAAGTRMNAAADTIGSHVIWPEQTRTSNPNGCWNWFDPAHQGRSGEAAAIAAIAMRVAFELAPDRSGIHVAGLSAGGAMAAILAARYPDLFASIGVHSGLPVGSARDVVSAFAAMRSGGTKGTALPIPAIVFHGMADRTVAPANGAAVAAPGPDASRPRRRTTRIGGRQTIVTRTETPAGAPHREFWQMEGQGHAWSGGNESGSYADPTGPDATAEMIRFFGEVDRAGRR